jgi:predicted permease
VTTFGRTLDQVRAFYEEVQRRVEALPGVRSVAVGSTVPWRDVNNFGADFEFTIDGAPTAAGGEDPRSAFRSVSPRYFSTLGIPILEGRDFADTDRNGGERVVIVSESVVHRLFPGQDVIGKTLRWTDARMQFINVSTEGRRIVGVASDVRDQGPAAPAQMIVYHPFQQELGGGRLFVHAEGNPYALVTPITRLVRELVADQPVEQGSTLEDIRTDVLAPSRLNALVIGGFAIVALAVAVVGVASVLAFSVSGRTREFGIRLALGSQPRDLLTGVLGEGVGIAIVGIGVGLLGSLMLTQLISGLLYQLHPRDPATLVASAVVLGLAAVIAAAIPAARAARVDVVQALRKD